MQSKICHCEERSDAAIRIPLCAVRDGEKENGFPRRAGALLGMTASGCGGYLLIPHCLALCSAYSPAKRIMAVRAKGQS